MVHLVLYADKVADPKGWELLGMLGHFVSNADVAFAQGSFSSFQCFMSSLMQVVLPRNNRNEIANWVTEEAHCWRDICVMVWGVTILRNSSLHSISIQVTLWASVVGDESFHCFYSNFGITVTMGEGH